MSTATPAPVPAGVPAPASTADALAMARAAFGYLAAADPAALTAPELAKGSAGYVTETRAARLLSALESLHRARSGKGAR